MRRSDTAELLVLLAVRLAGIADLEAILDRTFLPEERATQLLTDLLDQGRLQPFTFGESSGWILTEDGIERLAGLVADEVSGTHAEPALAVALMDFERINEQFVALVSGWQLRSTSATATGYGGAGASEVRGLLDALAGMGTELRRCLAPLTAVLPRFGRYPVQYAAAVERARDDGLRWVTGTGLLSCHTVWAELHQDLLASLGRGR